MQYERVLVTGGTGRIGRYVVKELEKHCAQTVLARDPERGRVERFGNEGEVEFVKGDIMDVESVRNAIRGSDAVVHVAGLDFDTMSEPQDFIKVNVVGTWNVLQAAHEVGIKRVVVNGSIVSFGISEMRPDHKPKYLPFDEAHLRKPVRGYSVSKLLTEEVCRAFTQTGEMSVICLQPTYVHFPSKMEEMVSMASDPEMRYFCAYVTAEDTAVANRLALQAKNVSFETLIIAAADSFRDEPILEMVERVFGYVPELKNPEIYKANPHASLVSFQRARDVIGFEPTSSWPKMRDEWLARR